MNNKMIKKTPVRDHMIPMIAFFNEMKIIEAEIYGET